MQAAVTSRTALLSSPDYHLERLKCIVFCGAINAGIDYAMLGAVEKGLVPLATKNTAIEISIWVLINALILLAGVGKIRQRVIAGVAPAITDKAAQGGVVFWSDGIIGHRWAWFILQSLIVPGVPVIIGLNVMCDVKAGVPLSPFDITSETCFVSVPMMIAINFFWRVLGISLMFTSNYVGAHNEDQPQMKLAAEKEN
jgi:hypothetical protein